LAAIGPQGAADMMKIDVLSLFPSMFDGPLDEV
jgi:hypothetical protein